MTSGAGAGVGGSRPLSRILVASPLGEPFDVRVLDRAFQLVDRRRALVHVLSVARVWGTALGLQHPGLYPSRREWQQQHEIALVVPFGWASHPRASGRDHRDEEN